MGKIEQEFASCLVKEASSDTKRKSYFSQMGALAPAAGVQAAFEFPKGYIDKKVENKINKGSIKGTKEKKIPAWKTGLGRGGGRLGAALITTPLFLGGIKQLSKAKTKKEKATGAAKIIGAGAIFSGIKGAIEGGVVYGSPFKRDAAGKLTPSAENSLRKIKGIAGVRGIIGTAAAAATAAAIAKNLQKKDKKSFYERVMKPTMIGAGIGGVKGGIEKVWLERSNLKNLTPRKVIGAVGGRAAAGALGAVVLSEIADKFMDKVSSGIIGKFAIIKDNTAIIPPGYIYEKTLMRSKGMSKSVVESEYIKMSKDDPERSPTSRAMYYALYDDLSSRGVRIPRPSLRDKVSPPSSSNNMGANMGAAMGVAAASFAPYIVEQALDTLPKEKVDMVLQDALDNIVARKGFVREIANTSSSSINLQQKLISGPANPGGASIAHELGHVSNNTLRKDLLQSAKAGSLYKKGRLMAHIIPMAAVALSGDTSFATQEELKTKSSFMKAVGIISGAAMAPKIIEESVANVKGHSLYRSAAKKRGIPAGKATSTYVKRMLPKYLGYAAPILAPALAAAYFKRKAERARR